MADKAGVSHTYTNHSVAQPYPRVGNQRSPRTSTDHIRVCYDMLRWALSGSDLRGPQKYQKPITFGRWADFKDAARDL